MIKVTTFYKFFSLPSSKLVEVQKALQKEGERQGIRGLILISSEGINATVSGEPKPLEEYKDFIRSSLNLKELFFKDTNTSTWNFRRLSCKIKQEIISTGKLAPHLKKNTSHLQPEAWQKELNSSVQILDVRNNYEVALGSFEKSVHLNMEHFRSFSDKLANSTLDKNKKTLIYCTGGIRCEKALEIMQDQGFKQVYQLDGGIINYLKKIKSSLFKGECFVFDHRVAVQKNLQPSEKYNLCPHCGQPGDVKVSCSHCEKPFVACSLCLNRDSIYKTCSKNCRYHLKERHTCYKKYSKNSNDPQKNTS